MALIHATLKSMSNMTGAEFKTIREACGLSVQDFSKIIAVEERTIRYWEAGKQSPRSPDVAETLLSIDRQLDTTADAVLQLVKSAPEKPAEIVLLRYREDGDLWSALPEWQPLPATCHAAGIARSRAALADLHVKTRIVYFEPDQYYQWLAGRESSSAMRAAWAAQVG
jgi:DNA-binding transcriptional regulator YiaG